ALPIFADWCTIDLVEDGDLRRVAVAHVDRDKLALAEELKRDHPLRPSDPRGPMRVLRTGQTEFVAELTEDLIAELARDDEHFRLLRELGLSSYISAPLFVHGRILGVISFATAESRRRFSPDDVQIAEELANRAAIAIENARLYQQTQDALRQREESLALLDTLQQNAPVGFAFVDRELRYVRLNEALAAIHGVSVDELLGRTVAEALPDRWPRIALYYRQVLEPGEPIIEVEVSGSIPAVSEETRHWLASYYPVRVHGAV